MLRPYFCPFFKERTQFYGILRDLGIDAKGLFSCTPMIFAPLDDEIFGILLDGTSLCLFDVRNKIELTDAISSMSRFGTVTTSLFKTLMRVSTQEKCPYFDAIDAGVENWFDVKASVCQITEKGEIEGFVQKLKKDFKNKKVLRFKMVDINNRAPIIDDDPRLASLETKLFIIERPWRSLVSDSE